MTGWGILLPLLVPPPAGREMIPPGGVTYVLAPWVGNCSKEYDSGVVAEMAVQLGIEAYLEEARPFFRELTMQLMPKPKARPCTSEKPMAMIIKIT